MAHKQAVVQTSAGTFVIDLDPEAAPNHVGYFMKLANDGTYAGTIFHRLIKYGIIQGGDPLSKDPAKAKLYGTVGLGVLKAEMSGAKMSRGAVAAVLQPGALTSRAPLTEKQQALVHNLQPEFNDTKHVKGIVSMARGDDPASATTSFFIVTGDAPSLDGKYTAFGRVVDGLAAADTIEQ